MAEEKMIRDALGSPVPQYFNLDLQMFAVRTVDGTLATGIDFSKTKMLRDKYGSPIPSQLWDKTNSKWVLGTDNVDVTNLTGTVSGLTEQLAEKATKNDVINVDSRVTQTNQRVDQIIASPATGITQQEIIDARQGNASLGANISDIKNRMGVLNANINNYVLNGNFDSLDGWTVNIATNTISNNTLTNTGNGVGSFPYTRYRTNVSPAPKKIMYAKARVRSLNPNATELRIGFANSTDTWIPLDRVTSPVEGQWYDISVMATTNETHTGSISVLVQHAYSSKEVANGKSIEVQKVVALNLTEIFGAGYEPTKDLMDQLLSKIPDKYFSGKLNADFTQKITLEYLIKTAGILQGAVAEAKQYTDQVTSNIKIPENTVSIPPVDLMKHQLKEWLNFESEIWNATNAGQLSTETNIVRFGTKAMKIIKTDVSAIAQKPLDTAIDLSEKMLVLSINIPDESILSTFRVSLRTGGTSWSNVLMYEYNRDAFKRDLHSGWNFLVINPMLMGIAGTATFDGLKNVNGIQITLPSNNTAGASLIVDSVKLVDRPKMQKPIVTITFDDGCLSDYTIARPYMTKFGYLGTSYIVPTYLSTPRFMSESHLRNMYEMGWDISNHGYNHIMMKDDVTAENWIKDKNDGYLWLVDKGYTRSAAHLAYPGGYNTPDALRGLSKYHKSGRLNIGDTQTIPANHLYQLKSYNGAEPLERVKARIDTALTKGHWLILMFHEINDAIGMNGQTVTEAHFKAIIDYLYQNNANVLPMSQVIL